MTDYEAALSEAEAIVRKELSRVEETFRLRAQELMGKIARWPAAEQSRAMSRLQVDMMRAREPYVAELVRIMSLRPMAPIIVPDGARLPGA